MKIISICLFCSLRMSRLAVAVFLVCLLLMAVGFAIPKPEDSKNRVLDKVVESSVEYHTYDVVVSNLKYF